MHGALTRITFARGFGFAHPLRNDIRRPLCQNDLRSSRLDCEILKIHLSVVFSFAAIHWWGDIGMSVPGQIQKSGCSTGRSALPSITDIVSQACQVQRVPLSEVAALIQSPRRRATGMTPVSSNRVP
jgi:hypothetical protein